MLTQLLALAATASYAAAAQVCAPAGCLDGFGISELLPYDKNKDTYYVPGAHSGNHSPVPQIEAVVDSGVSATTVGGPSKPAAFNDAFYSGEVSSSATEVVGDKWHSLFLPPSWYAVLPTGVALWGAIPDRLQISPLDPTEGTLRLESSICTPACTVHGTCTPNLQNTNGTCSCDPGWAGSMCESCAPGFFGSSCQACSSDCAACDDGFFGSGACKAPAVKDCNCENGSCSPSGDCVCAAGYVSKESVSSKKCNACSDGYFADTSGTCMPCPEGCSTCQLDSSAAAISMPTVQCLTCVKNRDLVQQDGSFVCSAPASCDDGQYWDRGEGSCRACSPACLKCSGPGENECTDCRSKALLHGVCVSFDARTGKCETRGEGGTMVNMGDSDLPAVCEACPPGCQDCSVSNWKKECSSCHDGYMLSGGECVKTCRENQLTTSTGANGTCTDCAAGCKSCAGSSDHCTKCNPGVAHEGKCVSTCPEGTQEADGQCAPCHPDCATCSAPGAADKCTTCPSSRPVYQSGRCVNYCPPKTYFHSTDSVAEGSNVNGTACGRCDDSCASCISLNGCTTCPDNHVLVGGKCQPANCTGPFATSLGTCLSSVVDLKFREPPTPMLSAENGSQSKPNDAKKYYPLASLAIIPIVILILAFLYVRRERRKTRDATAEFGRQLDEVEINKCIQRLNDDQDDYIPMATVRHAREDYKKKHSGDLASPRGVDEAVPPPYTPSAIDVAVDKKSPVAKSEHAFGGRPLIPSRQSVATTQQPNTASTPQQNAENIWAELYFSKPANTGRQGGDGLV